MKMTTGFDFQGYFITEYYDVIFDEILVGIGFGRALVSALDNFASSLTGGEATVMIEKLNSAKQELRSRVIKKAAKLGANALIGIDFESSKLGDLMMVSMTATAVKIEKIVSDLPYTEKDQREAEAKHEKHREQERKAELSKQREEYLRNGKLNHDEIINLVSAMDDAKEMYALVQDLSDKNPGLFTSEILHGLEASVNLGRIYGRMAGTEDFIRKITEYLKS